MSFPLAEISSLLQPKQKVLGVVVVVVGVVVRVATQRGVVLASSAESLSTGDRVVVEGGIATKMPVAVLSFSV